MIVQKDDVDICFYDEGVGYFSSTSNNRIINVRDDDDDDYQINVNEVS